MNPYLTADIPGTGGILKEFPDDFFVNEIPAYEPCGSGEHLYLTIEKRGITTLEAVHRIAEQLKMSNRDVGFSGMKDAVGVTRQMISLQGAKAENILSLKLEGITILSSSYHTNKLRPGHLKGNRFKIRIRGVAGNAEESTANILKTLQQRGVPNYFGYQRYGVQGNSHMIGAAMIRRNWHLAVDYLIGEPGAVRDEDWRNAIHSYKKNDLVEALRHMPRHCRTERDVLQRLVSRPDTWEKAFTLIHPRLKKLFLSAFQSFLFDKVVEHRLAAIDQVINGDLAWKHINGACFLVEDADLEAQRADNFEISASGPMFGNKMKNPAGEALILEQQIMANEGFSQEDFKPGNGICLDGERRPLRVPLENVSYNVEDNHLTLEFSLPKGSYATSVVREITKTF